MQPGHTAKLPQRKTGILDSAYTLAVRAFRKFAIRTAKTFRSIIPGANRKKKLEH
jgi:hypothetical protein